jgi:glycerol-3-phosphate acyltransferase PlsY
VLTLIGGLIGFLCGSIPFGILMARMRGVDLRAVGSGNIGATNAARAMGKKTGVLVLLLDAAKGAVPILIARQVIKNAPPAELDQVVAAIGGGAVLGHIFCPWLKLRGGKGVATGLGVFLALAPIPALIAAGAWVACYALTRVSSVGSLVAIPLLPAVIWWHRDPRPTLWLSLVLVPVIVAKHHANIRRLLKREESKV